MAVNRKILILPGDYIGPEVVGQVRRVINWLCDVRSVTLEVEDDHSPFLKGGAGFVMSYANKKGKVHLVDSFAGIIENEKYHKKDH